MATFKREDVHDVPEQAFQPTHISFPPREFGKRAPVKRSFQATWFQPLQVASLQCWTRCRLLFQVDAPTLSRKRKAPQRFQVGATGGDFHAAPEDRYRQIYYEALDFVIQAVRDRFDQPGYRVYRNLQELVVKACKGKAYQDELEAVLGIYKDDLSRLELEAQLPLLKPLCKEVCEELAENFSVCDAVHVLSVSLSQRELHSLVSGLL